MLKRMVVLRGLGLGPSPGVLNILCLLVLGTVVVKKDLMHQIFHDFFRILVLISTHPMGVFNKKQM